MTPNCNNAQKCVAMTPLVYKSFSKYIAEIQMPCALLTIPWPTKSSQTRRLLRRIPFFPAATPTPTPQDRSVTGLIIDWSINMDSVLALLDAFPELRWLHVVKTGVDHLPQKELLHKKTSGHQFQGSLHQGRGRIRHGAYLSVRQKIS